MQDYEKLGAFYLGRPVDPASGQVLPEPMLYDAKDLTTHAVCVGMTGSGKTGLCLGLIEEAAIDGIPVLAIDPKGDLGNLLLTFPRLRGEDFRPWIDPAEATRAGQDIDTYARQTADTWRSGLADWDQSGDRIERLRAAADFAIYTPGSDAGLSLALLRSLKAPDAETLADGESYRERVQTAVSGLLGLVGIDAHPLRSREHILVSALLDHLWRQGRDMDLPGLILGLQDPPISRVGVFELDAFFPADQRFELSMRLNNLVASPGFSAWLDGEPLDIQRLLWTKEGKPRVSILSIAHLSEEQRMFFVTLLLNELVAWVRRQPGTSSLRALLYMDEVFGYLPPTANPPSKGPLLTLLKQARAYGFGCVLATQNPVDLDYKALSNAGTWFIGRLQTERDKLRVLEGLEGAASSTGASFDRSRFDGLISGLAKRNFIMNNVHDREPSLFRTRWCLSYLRGPLTRHQIRELMEPRKSSVVPSPGPAQAPTHGARDASGHKRRPRPVLPPEISQGFMEVRRSAGSAEAVAYSPQLLGTVRVHFVSAKDKLDHWETRHLMAPVDGDTQDLWADAELLDEAPSVSPHGNESGDFGEVPSSLARSTGLRSAERDLKDFVYRTGECSVWTCAALKSVSNPGESEGAFRGRLAHHARELRDVEIEKLRKKYEPRLERLEDRIRTATHRVEREQAQHRQQKLQTGLSLGETLLGALFGRKIGTRSNVSKAGSTIRSHARSRREAEDVERAEESLESLREELRELEAEFQRECARVQEDVRPETLELDQKTFKPRKSDLEIVELRLVWTPR